jgi:predicted Zn-dependent peptidase
VPRATGVYLHTNLYSLPQILTASRNPYSKEIPTADVRELVLPNGIRVVSERIPGASSVAMGVWIGVGSRDEAPNEYGTAHFIEHVVFKGTKHYSMRDIMQLVESRGGMLNAFTTKEQTCYYTWTRIPYLEDAFSIVSDLVLYPGFSASSIGKERGVISEEILGLEDEPDELVFDLLEETIFQKSGLAHPVIGTVDSISKATSKSLRAFHSRYYAPNNIIIAASGAQSHSELFRLAKKYFSAAESKTVVFDRQDVPAEPSKGKRIKIKREGSGQTHLILGGNSLGMNDDRLPTLSVLITLLGAGMSSRLNLRLREELALAYETTAFHSPFAEAGVIGLYAAITGRNTKKAEEEMRKILRGLFTKPVNADELQRTKEQVIGSILLGLESTTARLMRMGTHLYYYKRYETLQSEIAKVTAVTKKSVNDLAEEIFGDETKLSVVSIASH